MSKHQPIESRFLDDRDLFGLRYSDGIVFAEVVEWEDTEYESYNQFNDIPSGSALPNGWQRANNASGDDILRLDHSEENTIMHVGIGFAPSVLELFIAYPEDSRGRGDIPNLASRPTPGSNFGGISGDDSPYREPTSAAELIIPPRERINLNFYNPGDDDHEPIIRFVIRKYKVEIINPGRSGNISTINRIAAHGSPMPIKTVGSMKSKANFEMGNDWQTTPITLKEARNL